MTQSLFADSFERILADNCSPAVVRAIEAGGDPGTLWSSFADSGFLELMAPEKDQGAALGLTEVFDLLVLLGRHAAPVPVAHSILARALLMGAKIAVPVGMITSTARVLAQGSETIASDVPFGLVADHVLASTEAGNLVFLNVGSAERVPSGVHGRLACTLRWPDTSQRGTVNGLGDRCLTFGATVHAALLVGAMARTFEITLQFCNERTQFGRPIGKFQAVQHQLAVMAEAVAAARFAAMAAFGGGQTLDATGAAIAKARTSEAASLVASTAHALHGASGITEDYDLQLFTRRLHEWRLADGSETYWQTWLGRKFLAGSEPSVARYVQGIG